MKTILLSIFLLLFSLSHSQDYIPILNEENIWSLLKSDGLSGSSVSHFYQFSGEEIINGKTYKILYSDDSELECRYREENGVLYVYNTITNLDEVRLDLTLEVGDIFEVATFSNGGLNYCFDGITNLYDYLEVIEVSTEFIAGEDRKVLTMSSMDLDGDPVGFEQFWIEGIGSTSGMFGTGIITYEILTILLCFNQNGVITFFNDEDTCVYDLGFNEFNKNQIILSPNPVSHVSVLQFPSEGIVDQVIIYDVNGKIVKRMAATSDAVLIHATEYTAGIHFYQLISKNKVIESTKFIIR